MNGTFFTAPFLHAVWNEIMRKNTFRQYYIHSRECETFFALDVWKQVQNFLKIIRFILRSNIFLKTTKCWWMIFLLLKIKIKLICLKDWKVINRQSDGCLTTDCLLIDCNCLTTAWQLCDNCLTSNRQPHKLACLPLMPTTSWTKLWW